MDIKTLLFFAQMADGDPDDFGNMGVINAVKDLLSVPAELHNAGSAQYPELMGNR